MLYKNKDGNMAMTVFWTTTDNNKNEIRTQLWGYGKTLDEAFEDLKQSIKDAEAFEES